MNNFLLQTYETLSYFVGLTFEMEVLWNIIPLVIATFLILLYFERYEEEKGGWNSYLSNSLVLLFVSMSLFRYIYGIEGVGVLNFIDYPAKTIAVVFLLLVSLILLRFNFEHLMPEKIARYLSSVLTTNLTAYAIILFVYSDLKNNWEAVLPLMILVGLLSVLLNVIRKPLRLFFKYIEKEKFRDQLRDVRESIFQIKELKEEVKFRERKLKEVEAKKLEKEEKQVKKVEKIIKKGIKKRRRKK